MKNSFVQKHTYIAAILTGLLCTFITALGMAVPQIMGLNTDLVYLAATIFLLISVAVGVYIMKRSKHSFTEYGFRMSEKGSSSKVWWFVPLLVIEVLPAAVCSPIFGIKLINYVIFACFTIAVGFNEEIYFRGLILKFLAGKGITKAIIYSSVIFGVLHLANALNGKNVTYLVLQMLFAFIVGFVLAEIVSITKSLWIVITWHAAHDFISITTGDSIERTALIVLAIQVAVLFVYAIGIWKAATLSAPKNTAKQTPEIKQTNV